MCLLFLDCERLDGKGLAVRGRCELHVIGNCFVGFGFGVFELAAAEFGAVVVDQCFFPWNLVGDCLRNHFLGSLLVISAASLEELFEEVVIEVSRHNGNCCFQHF